MFPNVANLPLRPPAALARSAASLDLLSGGRVEIGLGAGAYWDLIGAEGGPRHTPAEAVGATREAIDVQRALWRPGPEARLDGKHYGLYGAAPGPVRAHDIAVWIGEVGPRMLRLIGHIGDGWLPSVPHVPPGQLAAGHRIVDEAAEEEGRSPAAVRRLYNLSPGSFPRGRPGSWAEQLADLALEHGTSIFLLPANGAGGTVGDAGPLLIRPSPAPATPHGAARLWDRSTRPVGPPAPPERRYTRQQQEPARNLVAAHDQQELSLRQNSWGLGAYCASYCQLATAHHEREDLGLFPYLRRSEPGLGPVLDRLIEEHHAIHGVIERIDRALVARVTGSSGAWAGGEAGRDADAGELRSAIDLLADALVSHLTYEERELIEPMARFGNGW
ncbi:LLM class flavin-dependent oxidoreductase [Streptomyces sp. NBC_01217]|uniref:LLM class flavin-dependent oxidoreductase n=1 Tax=Streptomyces sp. NBC_01217 TaxID=2903779 RepID=UPI002E0D9384|nr:LLM class flavin-dependent oxidoreductase [Streptomyces sp. NBC_01217]